MLAKSQADERSVGGRHLLYDLLLDDNLSGNAHACTGIQNLNLLFDYMETFRVSPRVSIDLSLTTREFSDPSIVFQVEIETGGDTPRIPVAQGGRYDSLVQRFSERDLSSVGISFDLEEIAKIVDERLPEGRIGEREIDVYVMAIGGGFLKERMQVCRLLWDAGIKVFSFPL